MNYKLQFVKISPQHKIAGVGFAGNIFVILNCLEYLEEQDTIYVDMETNECVTTQDDLEIFCTKNSWEFYFDQARFNYNEPYRVVNNLLPAKHAGMSYDARNIDMKPDNYKNLKNKFYTHFKIKQYIKEDIEKYNDKNLKDKITLGVQIRLTDMKKHHSVSPVEKYIDKINEIVKSNGKIQQVFLSTDDNTIIETVKNNLKVPLIYHEDMFRANELDKHLEPHERYENTERQYHKYKLGLEVLKEIFTLSKCQYFLKADISAISTVAIILSENIKKVYKI